MASDIWALGMLLFEIFALEVPLSEAHCREDLVEFNRRRAHLQATQPASANVFSRISASLDTSGSLDTSESTDNPMVASPAAAEMHYGREYLIERLTDSDAPLRPPTRGGSQCRENPHGMDVPDALAPLLNKCWDAEPLRRPQVRALPWTRHFSPILTNAVHIGVAFPTIHPATVRCMWTY